MALGGLLLSLVAHALVVPSGAAAATPVPAFSAEPAPASSAVPDPSADGWSVVDSPNRFAEETVDELSDTECVSATDCWAVGYYSAGRYTGGVDMKTLIMHWDGTAWTVVDSPNANPVTHNYLTDVTCVSTSDCWAVGYYVNEGRRQTLTVHWDGTAWTIHDSPNTTPTADNLLHGVTCTATADCWAVGYHSTPTGAKTLIQRWNGAAWAIVTSPNGVQMPLLSSPWGADVLYAVTCASATDCWAVGNYFSGLAEQPLIVRWDGTVWAIVDSPNTTPTENNLLHDVTCASVTDCWAVGTAPVGGAPLTLIMHWDGTAWARTVLPEAVTSGGLYDVTCVSASDCWAVGSSDVTGTSGQAFLPGGHQTLIVRWDGFRWSVVDSPNTSAEQHNVVSGVSCASASDCWAVGWASGFAFENLTARWDGTSWTMVDSPNARASADHFLSDVTCVSASDCWAVGHDLAGNARQAVILHWDGTAWSIATLPTHSPDFDHFLSGVSCVSADDCWAVGHHTFGGTWQPLVMHWDGTAWTISDSPSTGDTDFNVLSEVTCASATDCWAVGHHSHCYYCAASPWQTLILRWDGTSWTLADSPSTNPAQANLLSEVTCVSVTDCWAVGSYSRSSGSAGTIWQTLVERWDGASWTIVDSPNTSATVNNVFSGVTCVSASDCWAAGATSTDTSFVPETVDDQTLIARWDGTSWTMADPPDASSQTNRLDGVTCASADECWAVGHHSSGGAEHALTMRWDGSAWRVSGSPDTAGSHGDALAAVTCVSAAEECWAVGHRKAGLIAQTLTMRYRAPDADGTG